MSVATVRGLQKLYRLGGGSAGSQIFDHGQPTFSHKVPSLRRQQQVRHLNVHEFISYSLLKDYDLPVPQFGVARTPQDAHNIATALATDRLIVKAQVLSGGRGKGQFKNGFKGGVHPARNPSEVKITSERMLGQHLVTIQSGAKGKICNAVMVAEKKEAVKEYYFAIVMERTFQGPVLISSAEGGVEIEQTASVKPDAIYYQPVDIAKGLQKEDAERIASNVGLESYKSEVARILLNMYELFVKTDASLVEVNPLIQDKNGQFYCLDAKLNFDDNAEFRQQKIFSLRDFTQEDESEVQAAKYNLNFISLDGDIGCMVNGAGLAMATMDIIKLSGGNPANFLDVGGSATASQVKEAFKIILDSEVNAILVNIFGGIMRCDVIAQGIIAAAKELDLKVPVVCRLQGTNVEEGKRLIKESGLKLMACGDLSEAANLVVKACDIVRMAKEAKVRVNIAAAL